MSHEPHSGSAAQAPPPGDQRQEPPPYEELGSTGWGLVFTPHSRPNPDGDKDIEGQ